MPGRSQIAQKLLASKTVFAPEGGAGWRGCPVFRDLILEYSRYWHKHPEGWV